MAGGGSEEQLAALLREAEALKQRLEEERQKLNDVTCEFFFKSHENMLNNETSRMREQPSQT